MSEDRIWYYAKLGPSNIYAERLLNATPPEIVAFFDTSTDLATWRDANGRDGNQKRAFFCAQSAEAKDRTRIVVLWNQTVYLLKPAGGTIAPLSPNATEDRFGDVDGNTAKTMQVAPACRNWRWPFAEVPHVVASMTANQAMARRTFAQIEDPGDVIGLESLLDPVAGEATYDRLAQRHGDALPFWCLSSVQLETLVAKLCEEAGCFVPAYRGGSMKDVDLFAYNDGTTVIQLGDLNIVPRAHLSLQVKRGDAPHPLPAAADYCCIAIGATEGGRCFGVKWLRGRLRESPVTKKWLLREAHWLPAQALAVLRQ